MFHSWLCYFALGKKVCKELSLSVPAFRGRGGTRILVALKTLSRTFCATGPGVGLGGNQ